MKRLILSCIAISAVAIFSASSVWAQSSGNSAATANNTVCTLDTSNGGLTAPGNCNGNNPLCFSNSATGGTMTAQIKLPNSSPGLLVTPSVDTGMYTNTLATGSSTMTPSTSTQTGAIVVAVTDSLPGYPTVTLTPNQTCVDTSSAGTTNCTGPGANCVCGVSYDERFQQLSATLGSGESVQLILSTLSAHSFNFTEGNVPGGIHTITMNWVFGCDSGGTGFLHSAQCNAAGMGVNSAAACAGPATLTVTQIQNFQHDSPIQSTGP
jgi:hypothetical protein